VAVLLSTPLHQFLPILSLLNGLHSMTIIPSLVLVPDLLFPFFPPFDVVLLDRFADFVA